MDRPLDNLSSTLLTGRSLVLLQLLSRLLTFTLNQSLVRLASPEVFGTAAIQFDLIGSTILFLSREGIRNALLRTKRVDENGDISAADARLSIVPFRLGLLVTLVVSSIYLYSAPLSTTTQPSFHLALSLYILSALVELLIEPLYIRSLRAVPSKIHVRVQAEGGMAIVKAVVTVASLVGLEKYWGGKALLGFALGQLTGSVWLAARYIWEFQETTSLLWVSISKDEKRYNGETLALAVANTRQSLVKHVLTEADRIAVGRISPLSDQGGYAVAMNYGSLIARIIFQPLEETLQLFFSSSLANPSTIPLLTFVLHASSHLLLLLPAFLPPLLPPILPFLLPRRYLSTSAPSTLETYLCWYLPLLSLNGLLESFHTASATPDQVKNQARWMIASSAVFVVSLYSLTRLEGVITTEQALIYSSCSSMIVRIAYAYRHARRWSPAKAIRLRQIVPRLPMVIASCVSGGVLRGVYRMHRWEASWRGWVELVGLGGGLGLAVLYIM
ncbi:oligosaccharide translocation protein RFT1, partial [Tremellales sp. Uapishka_1]